MTSSKRWYFAVVAVLLTAAAKAAPAQVAVYDSRAQFQNDHAGLVTEDFEGLSGHVDPDGLDLIANVVDASTNEGPIQPGDIAVGIVITTTDDGLDGLALLNPASPEGVSSNVIGPNFFVDSLVLQFNDSADAVGFDLYSFENEPGLVEVTFFNGNLALASITVGLDIGGSFIGISSTGPGVTRIQLSNEIDVSGGMANGELIDDIEFRPGDVCLLGDANLDGAVDLLDVAPFVSSILDSQYLCPADINLDGVVDLLDVIPFTEVLNSL